MVSVIRVRRRRVALVALLLSLVLASSFASSPVRASSPTLTVGSATVAVGQTTSIPIMLSEAPSGLAGYDLIFTLGNPAVAHFVGAALPEFGLTFQELVSSSEIHLKVADLLHIVETGAADVMLATMIVEGVKRGNTDIQITVNMLDDDGGYPIDVQATSGSISVQKAGGSKGSKGEKGDNGGSSGKGWGKGGKK